MGSILLIREIGNGILREGRDWKGERGEEMRGKESRVEESRSHKDQGKFLRKCVPGIEKLLARLFTIIKNINQIMF